TQATRVACPMNNDRLSGGLPFTNATQPDELLGQSNLRERPEIRKDTETLGDHFSASLIGHYLHGFTGNQGLTRRKDSPHSGNQLVKRDRSHAGRAKRLNGFGDLSSLAFVLIGRLDPSPLMALRYFQRTEVVQHR